MVPSHWLAPVRPQVQNRAMFQVLAFITAAAAGTGAYLVRESLRVRVCFAAGAAGFLLLAIAGDVIPAGPLRLVLIAVPVAAVTYAMLNLL